MPWCYFVTIILLIFIVLANIFSKIDRLISLKETQITMRARLDNSALTALDNIINEAFEEYKILEFNVKEYQYISNAIEKEIVEYLSAEVSRRISPLLLKKLEYLYNKEYVGQLIGKRVYLIVLNFVLEYNLKEQK